MSKPADPDVCDLLDAALERFDDGCVYHGVSLVVRARGAIPEAERPLFKRTLGILRIETRRHEPDVEACSAAVRAFKCRLAKSEKDV